MDRLDRLLEKARQEREQADLIVKWLERSIPHLGDVDQGDLTRQPTRKRRPLGRRKGPSVPVLSETILRAHPQGLTTTQLLAELRKLGYESRSKNPANTLNSILRSAGNFKRLSDGRWILAESADAPKAETSNGTKETPVH